MGKERILLRNDHIFTVFAGFAAICMVAAIIYWNLELMVCTVVSMLSWLIRIILKWKTPIVYKKSASHVVFTLLGSVCAFSTGMAVSRILDILITVI